MDESIINLKQEIEDSIIYNWNDLIKNSIDNIMTLKLKDKLKNIDGATLEELASINRFTENGDIILKLDRGFSLESRYFPSTILKLKENIIKCHNKLLTTSRKVSDKWVFRGRTYSESEFYNLFLTNQKTMNIEGFVSTTQDEDIALEFLKITGKRIKGNKVKVVFKIKAKEGVDIDDISDWGVNFIKKTIQEEHKKKFF